MRSEREIQPGDRVQWWNDERGRKARSYIARIRNARKHDYALSYYAYLKGLYPDPQRPVGLSLMAAQAVEMHLRELAR